MADTTVNITESITVLIMENNDKISNAGEIKPNPSLWYRFIKRAFDITVSILGIILLSPLILIVSLIIYIDDPGPVFFIQDRNGINGKVFKMWKFRSMTKNAQNLRFEMEDQNELDGPAFKMKDDPRITKVGKFIRKTSIDEIPQLINILKGEMSVVGPRPLPTYETELLTDEQKQRLLVKPGLLCYWQVCGRNNVSFDEWMDMDYRYISEAGILTDLKIIFMAIPAVLSGSGAA